MKRVLAMMLSLMMVLSVTACGAKPQETEPPAKKDDGVYNIGIVQLMQHSENEFVSISHVTPISKDSLYLENEGYGLKMQDATIEQVAKELYEYVLQK